MHRVGCRSGALSVLWCCHVLHFPKAVTLLRSLLQKSEPFNFKGPDFKRFCKIYRSLDSCVCSHVGVAKKCTRNKRLCWRPSLPTHFYAKIFYIHTLFVVPTHSRLCGKNMKINRRPFWTHKGTYCVRLWMDACGSLIVCIIFYTCCFSCHL